ncbi:replication-relaxation family protein [Miltoncostaea oceani]|uniref:replication-relaxation family protein n=1 Tax=Miltoncostaea oceani TaxID=2843216 RepID=UPI001C3E66E4|nr:replication-relaxation family protein [Miltoncostaea oceani]
MLAALRTVLVLSGIQAERLLFDEIAESARARIRRRVLGRLIALGLVETLERRVGGVRAGSGGLIYALSGGGHRLLDLDDPRESPRRRSAYTPGPLFLAHALAISEVYVSLVELGRASDLIRLARFAVEAAARFEPPGSDVVLRPDGLAVLASPDVEDVWWLEIDRGTESQPRLQAMLRRYLAFAESGVPGPGGVVPRVLISVTSEERARAVRGLIRRMPPLASELFVVCQEPEIAAVLAAELLDEVREPP